MIATKFSPPMKNLTQKKFFATCVIEFLQSNDTIEDLEYEDLLNHMNQIEPPDGIVNLIILCSINIIPCSNLIFSVCSLEEGTWQ